MQPLIAPPRNHLAEDAVRSLLTGDVLDVKTGLDLLDRNGAFVSDISGDLLGGEIRRDNYADVHGSCHLQLSRQLNWLADQVRPYMILSDGDVSARFNLGVYYMGIPETTRGEDPIVYEVDGLDALSLPQSRGLDTLFYAAGTGETYRSELNYMAYRAFSYYEDTGHPLVVEGTHINDQVAKYMTWVNTEDDQVTWLRTMNELLAAINYTGIWADQDGRIRTGPYINPKDRPLEWVFDTSDPTTNLVGPERNLTTDLGLVPNYFRFVARDWPTFPTTGDGVYAYDNWDVGPSSIENLGRYVHKTYYLEAATQTDLEAQAQRIINDALAATRRFTIQVDPLPIAGHFDVVELRDAGQIDKCQVVSWSLPLDGSPGEWVLEALQ